MKERIFQALGQSIHYEDWRGNFAEARQLADQWRREAAPGEQAQACLWAALVTLLSGELNAADALLDEAEAGGPDLALLAHSYRLLVMYHRYNYLPDGGGAAAVELSARWRGAPDLQAGNDRWVLLRQAVTDPNVLFESWYVYGFLCNLIPLRYMLETSRFAPPGMDRDALMQSQLTTIDQLQAQALQIGQAPLAAYLCWVGADLYFRAGKETDGLARLDQAENIAREAGEEAGRGLIALTRGDRAAAPFSLPIYWNFALQDSSSEASHLAATVEAQEGRFPDETAQKQAGAWYQEAEAHFHAAGTPRGTAALLLRQGYLANLADDYAGAEAQAARSADAFREAGDEKGARLAELHQLLAYLGQGKRQEALRQAGAIGAWGAQSGSLSYTLGLGALVNRFARHLLLRRGRYEDALSGYQAAEALHRALGANINAAQNVVDRGVALQAAGQREEALTFFADGLDAYEAALIDYPKRFPGGGDIVNNLRQRLLFLATNAYQLALQRTDSDAMERFAGRLARQLESLPGGDGADFSPQLSALLSGATPRRELDDDVDFWSLRLMAQGVIQQAAVLAPLYRSRQARRDGDTELARQHWLRAKEALEKMDATQRPMFEAVVWSEIKEYETAAKVYHRYLAQSAQGGGFLDQVVAIMRESAGEYGQREAALNQRRTHLQALTMWVRLRQYADALEHLQALITLDGERWWADDRSPWQLLSDCAELYEGLEQPETALPYYDQAIGELEARRRQLSRDELKMAMASDRGAQYLYVQAARCAFRLQRREEAFHYIEQGKARSLLDLLAASAQIGSKEAAASAPLRRWRQLNAQLSLTRGLMARERSQQESSEERIQQLNRQLREEESELNQLESELAESDPSFWQAISPEAPVFAVKDVSVRLTEGQGLLEYALLGEDLLAWVIDHRGLKQACWVQLDAEMLQRDAQRLYTNCQKGADIVPLVRQLSGQLLDPVATGLEEISQLYVVPYGALHRLPFHLLECAGKPLGQRCELAFLPNASVLRYLQTPRASGSRSLLAIGNPTGDLPSATAEATFVARLYGAEPLLGAAATESVVREQIGRRQLLHLATHGQLREDTPMASSIALAGGEQITLYELMGLQLQAELVVLSACETAIGTTTGGDDVVGLTRGLLAAGAKSSVVSLWKVDDLSTSVFMEAFYRALKAGAAPAQALRKAQQYLQSLPAAEADIQMEKLERSNLGADVQLAVTHSRQRGLRRRVEQRASGTSFAHPYYWAPFIYVGRF